MFKQRVIAVIGPMGCGAFPIAQLVSSNIPGSVHVYSMKKGGEKDTVRRIKEELKQEKIVVSDNGAKRFVHEPFPITTVIAPSEYLEFCSKLPRSRTQYLSACSTFFLNEWGDIIENITKNEALKTAFDELKERMTELSKTELTKAEFKEGMVTILSNITFNSLASQLCIVYWAMCSNTPIQYYRRSKDGLILEVCRFPDRSLVYPIPKEEDISSSSSSSTSSSSSFSSTSSSSSCSTSSTSTC